jgi:hypothetical protein
MWCKISVCDRIVILVWCGTTRFPRIKGGAPLVATLSPTINAAVLIMVASGLVAVGTKMVSAYGAITAAGSLSAAISAAITAIGGVAVLAGYAAAIAVILLALFLFLKK